MEKKGGRKRELAFAFREPFCDFFEVKAALKKRNENPKKNARTVLGV
jgi:hypothetical protein